MTTSLSATITRSILSLPDLALSGVAVPSGLYLRDGFGRPQQTKRRVYATDSPFIAGKLLVSSVADQSTQPLAFSAKAATTTDLYSLMDELEAALDQFTYELTVTENGKSRTWTCDPADVTWDDITWPMSNAVMANGAATIPVYPVSS